MAVETEFKITLPSRKLDLKRFQSLWGCKMEKPNIKEIFTGNVLYAVLT